jgi:hypothetical protein
MLSACGNRCDLCPRYIATKLGSDVELARVAVLWNEVGWRDRVLAPEEISCRGCASSADCRYGIRPCAGGKGLANCGLCGEYPCGIAREAFSRSAMFEDTCRERCQGGDFAQLKRAFFEKKKNLDAAARGAGED